MKYKYIKSVVPAAAMLFSMAFVSSCTGDLDVDPSIDPTTNITYDQSQLFNKVYSNLGLTGQQGPNGNADIAAGDEGTCGFIRLLWNVQELPTDEAHCCWGDGGLTTINEATWGASNEFIGYYYYRLYFGITTANFFLQETESKTDAETVTQRAEVRFLRALYYYYLLDGYGNVPFVTKVNTGALPEQIKRKDLYTFVETELKECVNDLKEPLTNSYGRVDKAAAWLLLSRLYLNAEVYTGTPNWAGAAEYASKVMNSNYELCPEYKWLFMADNGNLPSDGTVNTAYKEMILPILQDGIDTKQYAGTEFLVASTRGDNTPTDYGSTDSWSGNRCRPELIMKFIPNKTDIPEGDEATLRAAAGGDTRCIFYGKGNTLDIQKKGEFISGYNCLKYTNVRADGTSARNSQFPDTDFPLMRKAEAYLTFAEATMRQNNGICTNEARDAINKIRNRAKAEEKTSYTLQDVLDEWAREFYFEGRRRIDLIRYNQFGGESCSYTWQWKGGNYEGSNFSAKRNLYPIPDGDLNANSKLKQNDGY